MRRVEAFGHPQHLEQPALLTTLRAIIIVP